MGTPHATKPLLLPISGDFVNTYLKCARSNSLLIAAYTKSRINNEEIISTTVDFFISRIDKRMIELKSIREISQPAAIWN
jgi:hypothetical protein